jgi:hypothetical protein
LIPLGSEPFQLCYLPSLPRIFFHVRACAVGMRGSRGTQGKRRTLGSYPPCTIEALFCPGKLQSSIFWRAQIALLLIKRQRTENEKQHQPSCQRIITPQTTVLTSLSSQKSQAATKLR